jgi:hypothetical protein
VLTKGAVPGALPMMSWAAMLPSSDSNCLTISYACLNSLGTVALYWRKVLISSPTALSLAET